MNYLGIDIGGTNTRAVVLAGKKVLWKKEIKTPPNAEALENFIALLSKKFKAAKIGIGAPGVVSKNKIIFCPNISYLRNFSFRVPNKKIKLDNDARCFGRTEYSLGAGRRAKSILVFTIGTGIGRAYGKTGKILKIKKFEYPEKWERKYQELRDFGNSEVLSVFLTEKLSFLIKKMKPSVVIVGGGVMGRRGLKLGFKFKKPNLGKYAGAIGAALGLDADL